MDSIDFFLASMTFFYKDILADFLSLKLVCFVKDTFLGETVCEIKGESMNFI